VKVLVAGGFVALLVAVTPVLALGKRPATAGETAAVKSAVAAYIAAPKSPAAKDNRVVTVSISTVNASYAAAKLNSKSAGPSNALLRKTGGHWKVRDFGSGAFPCRDASAAILKDLLGGCAPA
jgi:hypothetical protein